MHNYSFPFKRGVDDDIKNLWSQKLDRQYITYDPDKGSLSKQLDIYTINFLPGRLQYLRNNPPGAEIQIDMPHSNSDGFCVQWGDIEKKQKIADIKMNHNTWRILANNSPIEKFHCVLIPDGQPKNQIMTLQYFEDLALLAQSDSNITLGFNSLGAGASQNHFHFHLFFNHWSRSTIDKMPIQRAIFQLDDTKKALEHTNQLVANNIGHNITMSSDGIVITSRRNEHIRRIRYGVDAISGRFLTTSLKQYEAISISNIIAILEQIAFMTG